MPRSPSSIKDVKVKKTHPFLRKGSKVPRSSIGSNCSRGATPTPRSSSSTRHSVSPRNVPLPFIGLDVLVQRQFPPVTNPPGNPFVITPVKEKFLYPKTAVLAAAPLAQPTDQSSLPPSTSIPSNESPLVFGTTLPTLAETTPLPPSPSTTDEHLISSEQVDIPIDYSQGKDEHHVSSEQVDRPIDYSQGKDEHHVSSEQVDSPTDYSQGADCIRKDLSIIDELASSEQVEVLDYSQGTEQVAHVDYSQDNIEQADPGYSQGNEQVGSPGYSQGQERVEPSDRSQVDEHPVSSEQVACDYSQDSRSSPGSPSKRGGRSSPLRFLSIRRQPSPVKSIDRYSIPLQTEFLTSPPKSLARSGTCEQGRAAIDRRLAESGLVKAPSPPMDLKEAILARGRSFMEKKRSSAIAEAAIASRRSRMEGGRRERPSEAMPGSIYPVNVTGRDGKVSEDTTTVAVAGGFQPSSREESSENQGMDSNAEEEGEEPQGGPKVQEQSPVSSRNEAQPGVLEEGALSERSQAGKVRTIRKGKSRMSLEQMNEYNAELRLTSPKAGSSSSVRSRLDVIGGQEDGSPKRTARVQNALGAIAEGGHMAGDTSSPAKHPSGSRTPSSFYQVRGDSYESSNYMVSPSKLPLDPPSFSDICSSTFVYEDRLPSGDKVHRPALVLGKEHTTSRLGLPVYPKHMELRSPPSIDLSSPPGRMLKPGQANDLYEPHAGPALPGQHRNELYKPRDPIEYSWLFRSMYSDNASDASITLDYEWESETDAGEQGKPKSSKTRRYTKHTRATRAVQRGEDHLRKLERSEKIRLADLARQQEAEAFLQGEPIAPLEFSTDRIAQAVAPDSSNSPGQGRSVRRGERVGMYTSGSQSSDEAVTAHKTAKEDLSSSSSRSRGHSENGMLVAAIRSRENWLPLQQVQASSARRSQQGSHSFEASSAKSSKETKEYYRALISRLNRPITAQTGDEIGMVTPVRQAHQSDEEDRGAVPTYSEVASMRGSIEAVAQQGAVTEEESDAAASTDGSEDEQQGLAAAGADGESAPPSPEYRGLPRRLNGVSQNRLSESFLRAEAGKRKASPASLSTRLSASNEGDSNPSMVQGRGPWRDGRSRHGFPPPETPRKWANTPTDSSTLDLDDPFVFRPAPREAVQGTASASDNDAVRDDLLSSPEAVKDTTIPMVDPKLEGAARSPDSPAMHFDPEFDLPRRKRAVAGGSGQAGSTPLPTESKRVTGPYSESPALSSLLDRLKRRVEERSQSPSILAASNPVENVHEAAYQKSMSIIQDFKRQRVGSTPALESPVDTPSNARASDRGNRIRWLPIQRTEAATGKLQRALMPVDLDKPKRVSDPEKLFWTPVPGEEATATSFNSDDLTWETVSSIRPSIPGPVVSPGVWRRHRRIMDGSSPVAGEDVASPFTRLERKLQALGDSTTPSLGAVEGAEGVSGLSPAQGEAEADAAEPTHDGSVARGHELSSGWWDESEEGDHKASEDRSFAREDAEPSETSLGEVVKGGGEATTTSLESPIRNLLVRIKERQDVVGEISPPRGDGKPAGPVGMPIREEWSVAQEKTDDACIAQQAGADQVIEQPNLDVMVQGAEEPAVEREEHSRLGRTTPADSPMQEAERSAASDQEELESQIFYSQAYLEKLGAEIQSAEERLQRARDDLFVVIEAAQTSTPWTLRTRASRLGDLSQWIWLLLFGVMAYITYVWWNQPPDFMDPFYTTQASSGQVWIMKAFGKATEQCEAGFKPACWVWNPTQQEQLLYSRRFTFTPI